MTTSPAASASPPIHVLHVISGIDPSAGGTATALVALARAQAGAGLQVSVVAAFRTPPAPEIAAALRSDGVAVCQLGPCTGPLMRHPDLSRALREKIGTADVVHIHALWEEVQYQAATLSRALGVPYIITPHGMLDPWSLSQSRWKKKLYLAWRMRAALNRAAAIHYTAEMERDLCAPLALTAPAVVEPNGVDLGEFDDLPARDSFRVKHPEIGDRRIVLFLGRVHPKKGLDLLVPAFARAAGSDAVLVIAGPDHGGYGAAVRSMARRGGIADRVLLIGMLRGRERIEALVDAELFVLPSYQENFGIAVVEALAAGCPVIISDRVNIYKEILSGGVGAVVAAEIEPLAAELSRWLGDESMRRRAGAAGPEFVRTRYDWNQIARRWTGHYAALAGRTNPSA